MISIVGSEIYVRTGNLEDFFETKYIVFAHDTRHGNLLVVDKDGILQTLNIHDEKDCIRFTRIGSNNEIATNSKAPKKSKKRARKSATRVIDNSCDNDYSGDVTPVRDNSSSDRDPDWVGKGSLW
jgi:hypothetical protein